MIRSHRFLAVAGVALLTLAACTSSSPSASAGPSGSTPESTAPLTSVRLQLQWFPQAQFAGYYAAVELGYFAEEGLDVEIIPGSAEIAPQVVGSQPDGPEFTLSWVPKVLQARESAAGSDLVNIAQIFQRSGTLSVSWVDADITSPEDFAGRKVGAWGFGNELEVVASARLVGLEPGVDFTQVTQPFDMSLLLNAYDGCAPADTDCVDVAEAMIYNEWAQLLETENPETGELFQPEDLNVIDYNVVGTAMLQDAVWARASWLAEAGNEDLAVGFLRASFRGWIYCRDNPDACIQFVVDAGSTLGAGHQAWMMNEINALIWPSPNGVGFLGVDDWRQTAATALAAGIILADPDPEAFRIDLATAAWEGIDGDLYAGDWTRADVAITPGGE
ncbi:MAG TPA: ABC transporter substrate-binding protein [Candidatus Limnocylindria bacterium]|nr:ABC transporter substrate-binding protein [Candidatus Limnocylindria bacterium]